MNLTYLAVISLELYFFLSIYVEPLLHEILCTKSKVSRRLQTVSALLMKSQ